MGEKGPSTQGRRGFGEWALHTVPKGLGTKEVLAAQTQAHGGGGPWNLRRGRKTLPSDLCSSVTLSSKVGDSCLHAADAGALTALQSPGLWMGKGACPLCQPRLLWSD